MNRTGPIIAFAAALLAAGVPVFADYAPPAGFDAGDSNFLPAERHTTSKVKKKRRSGWTKHKHYISFGAYGMSIRQRINPETGFPPQKRLRWGDTFVGIRGKKPRRYMSSNWSPWYFLAAHVRLKGHEKQVPQPTRRGRVIFAGLRQVTDQRIVGEAVWRDPKGGLLRARCIGWRGVDLFGLSVRYLPPEGEAIESAEYVLTCQPYDHSDRGHWQRQRWLSGGAGDSAITEHTSVKLKAGWHDRVVLHNRFAQISSGCVLAMDRATVTDAAVNARGNYVEINLRPKASDKAVVAVLGDWVGELYTAVANRWLRKNNTGPDKLLQRTRTLQVPPFDIEKIIGSAEFDIQLKQAAQDSKHGPQLAEVEKKLAATAKKLQEMEGSEGRQTLEKLVELRELARRRDELYRQFKGELLQSKTWIAASTEASVIGAD